MTFVVARLRTVKTLLRSLINIAISEPETTFRAMNEFLYLLTQPSLDSVFRNGKTGRLKSIFVFLVDNGHGEDPDSPLTQMCLARILSLLNLSKISQRSFAEYHSKRNFVERVHASENHYLDMVHLTASRFIRRQRLEVHNTLKTWKKWQTMSKTA